MQQLIVRAIEEFLRHTYGEDLWQRTLDHCVDPGRPGREVAPTKAGIERLVTSAARELGKSPQEFLEDGGAWLARREAFRRLLRFSGRDFRDFILSLEELPGRAHFVIPDLGMPEIVVTIGDDGAIRLTLPSNTWGWTSALGGVLRAMADDYGALSLIAVEDSAIVVHIPDDAFAIGRDFSLAATGEGLSKQERR